MFCIWECSELGAPSNASAPRNDFTLLEPGQVPHHVRQVSVFHILLI